MEKYQSLIDALQKVDWIDPQDGDLVRWASRNSALTLAQELHRVLRDGIDIQDRDLRRLPKFFTSRASLDAICAGGRYGLEVDRRLHKNPNDAKLRKFANECVKLLGEPRHPDYTDFEVAVLHYFTSDDRTRFRAVFAACQIPQIAGLFDDDPIEVTVPVADLLKAADARIDGGKTKDVKYWGEIKNRCQAIGRRKAIRFLPKFTSYGGRHPVNLLLFELHVKEV